MPREDRLGSDDVGLTGVPDFLTRLGGSVEAAPPEAMLARRIKPENMVTPSKTAAPAQWMCKCWHSTKGREQDAVANDPDQSGLVFWAFAERGQHPGNRGLA